MSSKQKNILLLFHESTVSPHSGMPSVIPGLCPACVNNGSTESAPVASGKCLLNGIMSLLASSCHFLEV